MIRWLFSASCSTGLNYLFSLQDGYTALIWASQEGHTEVVKVLLADGRADLNGQSLVSNYNLHYSIFSALISWF